MSKVLGTYLHAMQVSEFSYAAYVMVVHHYVFVYHTTANAAELFIIILLPDGWLVGHVTDGYDPTKVAKVSHAAAARLIIDFTPAQCIIRIDGVSSVQKWKAHIERKNSQAASSRALEASLKVMATKSANGQQTSQSLMSPKHRPRNAMLISKNDYSENISGLVVVRSLEHIRNIPQNLGLRLMFQVCIAAVAVKIQAPIDPSRFRPSEEIFLDCKKDVLQLRAGDEAAGEDTPMFDFDDAVHLTPPFCVAKSSKRNQFQSIFSDKKSILVPNSIDILSARPC
ncbi:hypothetical protein EDD21DRAFT_441613 [Dissophora ornata]|nr:hypothetical protein EDD21DRAFT_441613 [Dissophora ornata]